MLHHLTLSTVVVVYHSVSAIKSELPSLLEGTNVPPRSGLGSNFEHPESTVAPKAIVVGAGFSNSEFDEVKSIAGGEKLAWLKPDERMVGSYIFSSRSTMLGKIADRAKKVLGEKGSEPGVWQY